jgi:hypothetical protein
MILSPHSVWKHKRTGNYYEIILAENVFIEATTEPAVVYERVNKAVKGVWVRPLDEFMERFEYVP